MPGRGRLELPGGVAPAGDVVLGLAGLDHPGVPRAAVRLGAEPDDDPLRAGPVQVDADLLPGGVERAGRALGELALGVVRQQGQGDDPQGRLPGGVGEHAAGLGLADHGGEAAVPDVVHAQVEGAVAEGAEAVAAVALGRAGEPGQAGDGRRGRRAAGQGGARERGGGEKSEGERAHGPPAGVPCGAPPIACGVAGGAAQKPPAGRPASVVGGRGGRAPRATPGTGARSGGAEGPGGLSGYSGVPMGEGVVPGDPAAIEVAPPGRFLREVREVRG